MTNRMPIRSGYIPKYRQLLSILRNRILSGELVSGDRLPSEEELSRTYEVSRGTVRKAISQLEDEKLVRTDQGIGSFVRAMHPRAVPFHFTSSDATGTEVSYEVLAQEVVPAPSNIVERLRIAPGERVIHIRRRRFLAGRAVGYTVRYLPEALCPSAAHEDLTRMSVHDLLVRACELPLLRAEVEIEAHRLTASEAKLLDAEAGTMGVIVERLTFTAPNRPAVWYGGLFIEEYHLGVRVDRDLC